MLRLKQDTPTQTGQQPLKYKHHLQMNVVLQSGGDASVSFKSLPLPPNLVLRRVCTSPSSSSRAFGFSTGSRDRVSRPLFLRMRHLFFFFFGFLTGIEHSNKRLNWSSSSLVSQTLEKNFLIYNNSLSDILGRCSTESLGDI